ncbi:MAG: membrane protein [Pirellulaceae bacterium]|nr:MAG: membrane protein [Pirellulaceae bacterium]
MNVDAVQRLRRRLTLHFAVIANLTTWLLATETQSVFLPLFILIVCAVAYVLVDVLAWFHLGVIGSCLGMTVASGIAIASYLHSQFIYPSETGQLMAVAGLLVYPMAVLFFQRKNLRVYEQLAVFLLLEMVVAALVNSNLLFGIMLAPILLLWISALFLFSRYATVVAWEPSLDTPMPKLVELLYRKLVRSVMGDRPSAAVATVPAPGDAIARTGNARGNWWQAIPLGVGALVFAGLFFILTPRTRPGSMTAGLRNPTTVGLPNRLTFGSVGRILQNRTPVMRVTLRHAATNTTYQLASPPYLRARVFDSYGPLSRFRRDDHGRGEWYFRAYSRLTRLPARPAFPPDFLTQRDRVEVEFTLESYASQQLYLIPPAYLVDQEASIPLRNDPLNMILQPLDESEISKGKSVRYRVGSYGFSRGQQVPILPARLTVRDDQRIDAFDFQYLVRLTRGFGHLSRLDAYRRELLQQQGVQENDLWAVAAALEQHLAAGPFRYTLDLPPPFESELDPIEDFVLHTKRGHCQYFASAMVAMLRQSGIPARLVVGYRPREFNALGEYFSVRQSDAHAWVEALFRRTDLEQSPYARWLTDAPFYWVRFDPTPGDESSNAIQIAEDQAIDFAEKIWKDYVVEGTKLTTAEGIYAPVSGENGNPWSHFKSWLAKLKVAIQTGSLWTENMTFHWSLALTIILLGTMVIGIFHVTRWLPRISPRLASRLGMQSRHATIQQAFFLRCMRLLARAGWQRQPQQTPREFTRMVAERLAQEGNAPAKSALERLTAYYYYSRFTPEGTLSTAAMAEIRQALEVLAQAVERRSGKAR